MARKLRYLPDPTRPVEITVRCIQGRYLLRPSETLNRRLVGVVAYAAEKHDVAVHAIHAMSNHYAMIVTVPNATTMADFMCLVNQQISLEVGHLHDWKGPMWQDRYHAIPIDDEASELERLRYLLSNGVKEFAVSRVAEWPGVQSDAALLGRGKLKGEWVDRTALHAARLMNPDADVDEADFTTPMHLELKPLPSLAHLSHGQRVTLVRRIIREVEAAAAEERRRTGKSVLGAARVLAMHPHHRPASMDESPMPLVHTTTKATRKLWRAAYAAFVEAYRRAADALRAHRGKCDFPEGCVLPLHAFCDPPAAAT